MVNGVNKSAQQLSLSLEQFKQKKLEVSQNDQNEQVQNLSLENSFAFEMNYQKSMQVMEGEAKRSISKSLSFEFSISIEANGKLSAKAGVPGEGEESQSLQDLFTPEKTAGRIVDFVKSAFDFLSKFGEKNMEDEDEFARFQQMQTDAVKEGFKQARGLLGAMPDDVESGIDQTFDLVMEGLDKFFNGEEEEGEDTEAVASSLDPSNGNFYSSQSFSLSFQLSVSAEGNFDPEELNNFVEDSMGEVQSLFDKFLSGGEDEESGFNPLELFNLGGLNEGRIRGLLGESTSA